MQVVAHSIAKGYVVVFSGWEFSDALQFFFRCRLRYSQVLPSLEPHVTPPLRPLLLPLRPSSSPLSSTLPLHSTRFPQVSPS